MANPASMLVLDYVRQTAPRQPTILLPRFHSGHLGFVPDTHVHVSTPSASPETAGTRTEVLVTPFQTTPENAALISVVVHDAVGAVRRVVQALSWLNVNIEVQESSSIDHLDLHRIGMIVDLGSASPEQDATPTSERVQQLYRDYAANVPIHSRRYLNVFDTILAQCGDLLAWQKYEGRYIPALYVRPLPRRDELNASTVLLRASGDGTHTEIELPSAVVRHVQKRLDIDPEATRPPLSYVFVSDTNDRTLRTFFLPKEQAARFVHIGIRHDDRAGTLARVLALLAESEFNIVTSLLRKYQDRTSVWEGVLEYRGTDTPPRKPRARNRLPGWYRRELLPWVHAKLAVSPALREAAGCNVALGPPLYPKACGGTDDDNWLMLSPHGRRTPEPSKLTNATVMDLLAQRQTDLKDSGQTLRDHPANGRLLETTKVHRQRIRQRTLFLSYPKTASRLVNAYLKPRLELPEVPSYHVTEYQNPAPSDIRMQIISRIRDADYFVAIWHPEQDRDGRNLKPAKISPWMFFEYGVACALGKPTVLACHEELKDIEPTRLVGLEGLIMYVDANFALEAAPQIQEACRQVFRDEEEAVFNDDPAGEMAVSARPS